MKSLNITNFRNPELIRKLVKKINLIARKPVTIMEVCGTHTMAIAQYGIRNLLPPVIKLLSGPGCPVCVTPVETIDAVIKLAMKPNVIIASFGDMIKVPGSKTTLDKVRGEGADVRIIYSPLELLDLAVKNPGEKIVFAGVGFETTSPAIAAAVIRAKKEKIKNLFVLTAFKIVPPALKLIANRKNLKINGFLLPGHVSAIIGSYPYQFLVDEFGISGVISGFEPVDILLSVYLLVKRINKKTPGIDIQYSRSITPEGNIQAQEILNKVFKKNDSNWRAIGNIPDSGLKFNDDYMGFCAKTKFDIDKTQKKSSEPKNCLCGRILLGLALPDDCPLFGRACTPQNAIGPCMVSSEGTCAAYYKYGDR